MSKSVFIHIALEVDDDMSTETVLDSLLGIFPTVSGGENHVIVRETDPLNDFLPNERGSL